MALEQAEAKKAAARRRVQVIAGAVLGAAAIAAVAVAVLSGGGDGGGSGDSASKSSDAPSVKLPPRRISDLNQAAKAAGCKVVDAPAEGRTHISDSESFSGYKTNPPTSGTHRQTPAQDGRYSPGSEPDAENLVHALEHGRIIFWFKPKSPKATIDQLEALYFEPLRGTPEYHTITAQNNTGMPFAVAASAWTHYVGCPKMNNKVLDVFRAFREKYVDKGPELVS